MDRLYALLSVLVLTVLIAGAFYWSQREPTEAIHTAAPAAPAPALEKPQSAAPPAEPAIQHPIEAPQSDAALPASVDADSYIKSALIDLLGKKGVASFLRVDDFVRRAVATVDNLARPHASSRLWPVNQTPGRFAVVGRGNDIVVNSDNALRYAPFVVFVESVDTGRAVALYTRLYPLFQKAYEQLGYRGQYFNDRLVSVIDQLLETPDSAGPLKVELTKVKGSVTPLQPWVRYRLSDPALEGLSAGQKILLRTGPVNERRLKAKLLDIRRHLVREKPSG